MSSYVRTLIELSVFAKLLLLIFAVLFLIIFTKYIQKLVKRQTNQMVLFALVYPWPLAIILILGGVPLDVVNVVAFLGAAVTFGLTMWAQEKRDEDRQQNIQLHIAHLLELVEEDISGPKDKSNPENRGWIGIFEKNYLPSYDLVRLEKSSYIYELDAMRGKELIKAINKLDQKIKQYNEWRKGSSDQISWIKSDLFSIAEDKETPHFFELIAKVRKELNNYKTPNSGVRKKRKYQQ